MVTDHQAVHASDDAAGIVSNYLLNWAGWIASAISVLHRGRRRDDACGREPRSWAGRAGFAPNRMTSRLRGQKR
jgi:hypothetical protein